MKLSWTEGLDGDQKKDIQSSFKSATVIRNRLAEMCESKIKTSLSPNKAQYDSPNWTYKKADEIGYRRALEEIIGLLKES
jgi:hypothetical protein